MQQAIVSLREQRKQDNRRKLIDATIAVIAESGISGVTVSRVVERAGVSRGLINLHFDTKEAMLAETLETLSSEWSEIWRDILEQSFENEAERLVALLLSNLRPPVFGYEKLATWNCFFADPKYREVYQERCYDVDQAYLEEVAEICAKLDADGDYGIGSSLLIARALRSMTGGLWLELLTEPDHVSVEEAQTACRLILSRLFPQHMSAPKTAAAGKGKKKSHLSLVGKRRK